MLGSGTLVFAGEGCISNLDIESGTAQLGSGTGLCWMSETFVTGYGGTFDFNGYAAPFGISLGAYYGNVINEG